MKVTLTYPQVVMNTIELDIPEEEIKDKELYFEEVYDLVQKYGKSIPSYDEPDYHLCKSYNENINSIRFQEVK